MNLMAELIVTVQIGMYPTFMTMYRPDDGIIADNEHSQNGFGRAEYFQELEDTYRAGARWSFV